MGVTQGCPSSFQHGDESSQSSPGIPPRTALRGPRAALGSSRTVLGSPIAIVRTPSAVSPPDCAPDDHAPDASEMVPRAQTGRYVLGIVGQGCLQRSALQLHPQRARTNSGCLARACSIGPTTESANKFKHILFKRHVQCISFPQLVRDILKVPCTSSVARPRAFFGEQRRTADLRLLVENGSGTGVLFFGGCGMGR